MNVNLVFYKKNGTHRVIPLPSSVTMIGRRRSCDLRIPLTSISRKHCQLNLNQGVWMIRDLGSRNGTYLNGKRVKEDVIQAGDSIGIGPLAFMFQVDGQPAPASQHQSAEVKPSREDLPAEDTAGSAAGDDEFGSAIELDDAEGLKADNFEMPDDVV